MLIEPINEQTAISPLPHKAEAARGLFAWGRDRLNSGRLVIAWLEFIFIFVLLPTMTIVTGLASAVPIIITVMLSSTIIFLSMTRSFHWADLLPVDAFSEWRLVLGFSTGFAALAAAVTLTFYPDAFLSPSLGVIPMLVAYPVLTALPIELVYRALFLRRYGHLFNSELGAICVGALLNGLAYFMLSTSIAGAIFGTVLGASLGWFYLRTGQFALSVFLHWIAAMAIWLIGPGLGVF